MVGLGDIIKDEQCFLISVRFDDSDPTRWENIHSAFIKMLNEDYDPYYHHTTSFFIVKEYSANTIMEKIKNCGANEKLDHVMVMDIHASKALFLGNKNDYLELKSFISTFVRV